MLVVLALQLSENRFLIIIEIRKALYTTLQYILFHYNIILCFIISYYMTLLYCIVLGCIFLFIVLCLLYYNIYLTLNYFISHIGNI